MTPENKKLLQQWGGGCLIAALFFYLFFYLGKLRGESICSEKPNSSKEEIQVVVKDSIETMKWKERAISAEKKLSKWQIMYDHLKLTITQKQINDEKTNKFIQAICNDSIILFRDSLRAEYRRKRWGLVDNLQLQ